MALVTLKSSHAKSLLIGIIGWVIYEMITDLKLSFSKIEFCP